jgi:hypothetical protein
VWFHEEADLLAHMPIVPTVGNHEMTDNGVAYSRYFQHRDRPAYWSFDYGPLHVVVLDCFETPAGAAPKGAGISEAQKAWFEEDLRSVSKERHVWVLVHQGPYAHPAHPRGPGHGGSDAVRNALNAAGAIHPIEVVFAGHEHYYERGQIDGLNYFVLGGGGAPLDEPDDTFPGVKVARKALSYAVMQVCGCHVTGVAKDLSGRVFDTFTLSDCPTPCGAPSAAVTRAPVAAASAAPSLAIPLVSLSESPDAGVSDGGSHRRNSRRRHESDGGVDAGP